MHKCTRVGWGGASRGLVTVSVDLDCHLPPPAKGLCSLTLVLTHEKNDTFFEKEKT